MAKKGENIYKRKDGRWEARYVLCHEPSGRIRYGSCYGQSYREAKEKAAQARQGAAEPPPEAAGGPLLSSFCDEWLKRIQSQVRQSTFVKYASILEKHIKPDLGAAPPGMVSETLIDRFRQSLLTERELAPKTVRDILAVLRSVLSFTAGQFPGLFPLPEIRYPKAERRPIRVLSVQEQRRLTDYLLVGLDACKFGILLALFTGLRLGELCALQWKNISVPERTIRVGATLQRLRDLEPRTDQRTKLCLGEPKSGASCRVIPMSESVAGLCGRMESPLPAAFVLTGTPEPMEPRALQYRLQKYTKDCGLEGVHTHTLRHSFATRCVEAGVELKCLSEILGHSSASVTLDRYVHSSWELKLENVNKPEFLTL